MQRPLCLVSMTGLLIGLFTAFPPLATLAEGGVSSSSPSLEHIHDFISEAFVDPYPCSSFPTARSGQVAVLAYTSQKPWRRTPFAPTGVYVYERDGPLWQRKVELRTSLPEVSSEIGDAVDISADGTTIAVTDGNTNNYRGVIHLFTRDGSKGDWPEQAILYPPEKPADAQRSPSLASSVTLSANGSVLVAADIVNDAAYVFSRIGGVWGYRATLTASGGHPELDVFGTGIDLSPDGRYALVGKGSRYDKEGNISPGAVYAFERSVGTWKQKAMLTPHDAYPGDGFGSSIEFSDDGNSALIARYDGTRYASYLFIRQNGIWHEGEKTSVPEGALRPLSGVPTLCRELLDALPDVTRPVFPYVQ